MHSNNKKRPQLNLMNFCFCSLSTSWSMRGVNLLTAHRMSMMLRNNRNSRLQENLFI